MANTIERNLAPLQIQKQQPRADVNK